LQSNNNQKQDSKEHDGLSSQQFNPNDTRRPGRRPDREDQRDVPPPPPTQGPGMGQQPRTAPPNFIPEGPNMEQGPMGNPMQGPRRGPGMGPGMGPGGPGNRPGQGPEQFGSGGGNRVVFPVRPRDLQRCVNNFTYIWLVNGNNFWFYPIRVDRQFVQGFRWRGNRWEFDTLSLSRIFHFRCF